MPSRLGSPIKILIDVSRSSDFGQLVVSGTDRVQLMQRIEGWNMEIEDKLDTLRAFEVF